MYLEAAQQSPIPHCPTQTAEVEETICRHCVNGLAV